MWSHRIMLEAGQHGDNAFLTLTYDEDHVPKDGSLKPRDLQLFLKRLRKKIEPDTIRFYAVGEYGDDSWRPHYHVALFGFPTCRRSQTQFRNGVVSCCDQCQLVSDAWGKGIVFLGTLEAHSAQYVAGYVTKKMTAKDDPRLAGKHPEFARMSNRPYGIGAGALEEVAATLKRFNLDQTQTDVPSALRHGSRTMPLGRYMRGKLREAIGKEKNAPRESLAELEATMRDVYARSINGTEVSPKKILLEDGKQKVLQMEVRSKIFKQGKKL